MKRHAFTLIELLVVIAIIGTLIGLLVPAVMKARGRGLAVQATSDIYQLDSACKAFYTKYNFYPPSRLALCENYGDYFAGAVPKDQLHADSITAIKRMWPRIASGNKWTTPRGFIDWNGNGVMDGEVILEGDQCLVFFLGGIKQLGFGGNPIDPSDLSTTDKTTFYQFKNTLMVTVHGNAYPSMLDAYGALPYAYFTNYNRYGSTDCPTLGVSPYRTANGYQKPDSFQIICGGEDRAFGPGNTIWPNGSYGLNGIDDRSNFTTYVMGAKE